MIEAHQIIKKLGKRGFRDFVIGNKSHSETGAERQHRRRFGKGRVLMAYCEHGIKTVDNYELTGLCMKCKSIVRTQSGEFHPYFNVGLGAFVESRSDERSAAKRMGLQEAG